MGRAVDLFVTYRFIKLLTTPFDKTDAYKMGIIDEKGNRTDKKLYKVDEKNAYTILHKLVFNIKKIFMKVPGLRTKVGTYAAALFLLKDTFKEHVEDERMFEKEFMKFLEEQGMVLDDSIVEEVNLDNGKLPKGLYVLTQDVIATGEDDEDEIDALAGDEVETFEDVAAADTILGVDVFPVIHKKTKQKIFVSAEDIKELDIGDLL
jgi:hypothetical protein